MRTSVMIFLGMLLAGCGAGQNLIQNGQTAVTYPDAPIRFMRETPLIHPRECPISGECPGTCGKPAPRLP